jgi:glycosyltransferase involved in cell wall biosynthesis
MGWFPQQEGGLNRVYYNLARHLPATGVRVRGLVAGHSDARDLGLGEGVRAFGPADAPLPARWWAARRAAVDALGDGADLVASHFALYTAPLLDLLGSLPLVVHFHGPWAEEAAVERPSAALRRARHELERAVYRRADRFIVLSEAFAEVLAETYGVAGSRIRIVPGGTDLDRFDTGLSREEARRRLGWPTHRPTVLAVRRLARRMGLETLLDAMTSLRERVPDVRLCIAGRGPLEEALRERIVADGLAESVELLGFVSEADLPLAYRAADVSVVPTQVLEGFGLITVESLAAGTPVLVTPVGGLPEAVRDLSTHLVLDGPDRDSIAGGLLGALDGSRRLPDAEVCRRFAHERYGWRQVARRTRDVYHEVL